VKQLSAPGSFSERQDGQRMGGNEDTPAPRASSSLWKKVALEERARQPSGSGTIAAGAATAGPAAVGS
jgi:hypothetical protein